MLNFGRWEGDTRHFNLYDPKITNRKVGFFFEVVAEWFDGEWLSQCEKCHSLRCLVIKPENQTWYCQKCNRKGTFKKPEEKLEKKTDRSAGRGRNE